LSSTAGGACAFRSFFLCRSCPRSCCCLLCCLATISLFIRRFTASHRSSSFIPVQVIEIMDIYQTSWVPANRNVDPADVQIAQFAVASSNRDAD
jgi:hypothetical protein